MYRHAPSQSTRPVSSPPMQMSAPANYQNHLQGQRLDFHTIMCNGEQDTYKKQIVHRGALEMCLRPSRHPTTRLPVRAHPSSRGTILRMRESTSCCASHRNSVTQESLRALRSSDSPPESDTEGLRRTWPARGFPFEEQLSGA